MAFTDLNPIDNAQSFDKIEIDGDECPGICVLKGFKRPTEWDVKRGKGTKGGTVTLTQLPPAKGTATFSLWLTEHFSAWATFRRKFKYDPTKKTANAVDIYHPWLADLDIISVVTESIGLIEHQGKGLYTIEVELLEYLPPPKASATSTPDGSKKGNGVGAEGKGDVDIETQQKQQEIKQLLAEAKPL